MPPKDLYFPVLPIRIRERLIFPLCNKCALEEIFDECEHDEKERSLVGVWTTMELKKAIELKYKITEIYEVWHFPKLSPNLSNENGLFKDFINTYIKLKVEASGYPKNDMTKVEKDEYIRLYKEKEEIELDKDNIKYNAGMRALGKLVVVSFWGKFGQACNHNKTTYITEPQEFFKLLGNNTISVTDALLLTDEMLHVTYEQEENYLESPAHSSIFIATFVTAYARLELYNGIGI